MIDRVSLSWSSRAVRIACGLLCLVFILTALSWPLGWDQGLFVWVGDVIEHGGTPYRDAFEIKGPLVYYLTALGAALFGPHAWSIRVVDIALAALGAWTVARATSRVASPEAGPWAAMLFICWYMSGSYWHTAQPDCWAGVLIMAGTTSLLDAPERPSRQALAGALVGAATCIKPFYGIFLAVPAAGLLPVAIPWRRRLLGISALGAGFAAVTGAMVGWLAAHQALPDLIDDHIRYNLVAYSAAAPGSRLRGLVEYLLAGKVIVVAAPLAIVGLWAVERRPARLMLAVQAVLAAGVVVAQNRFYEYHWLPLLPVMSVLTAAGFRAVLAAQPAGGARMLAWVMAGVVAIHALAHPAFDVGRWLARTAGLMTADAYYDGFQESGNQRRMVRYIRTETQPNDRIQNFGWNAGIPYLADRRSATRFGYSLPLMLGEGSAIRDRLRAEFMTCLRQHPPVLIVVGETAPAILGRPTTVADFPEFDRLLAEEYRKDATFGTLEAWRRTAATAPQPAGTVRCP